MAHSLQDQEDEERREEKDDRAMALALQEEADDDTTAEEWIEFYQQPAESEMPDLCIDTRQHEWRSSGSGTTSGKDSEEEESCGCGAFCTCMRRYGVRRLHNHRSSLRASWIRARGIGGSQKTISTGANYTSGSTPALMRWT